MTLKSSALALRAVSDKVRSLTGKVILGPVTGTWVTLLIREPAVTLALVAFAALVTGSTRVVGLTRQVNLFIAALFNTFVVQPAVVQRQDALVLRIRAPSSTVI